MRRYFLALVFLIAARPLAVLAKTSSLQTSAAIVLAVPYTSEIPNGRWVGPWKNACEEAGVTMVNQYYLGNGGNKRIPPRLAVQLMTSIFAWEDRVFGFDSDTDAAETARIINEFSSAAATVKYNPTLDDIKKELAAGHPVISFHYGFDLHNPLIPFKRGGSYYHVMVLIGYDDAAQEFIVNDPGNDRSGLDYRYPYATIINTLHNFDHATRQVDGRPVVLFTRSKTIIRAAGGKRIYLIEDGRRRYVSSPAVFKKRNWSWKIVRSIDENQLNALPAGPAVNQ